MSRTIGAAGVLAVFSAPALKCGARDCWIGWEPCVVFHIISAAVLEFRRATDKEVSRIASVLWSSMTAPECRTDNYLG